MSMRQIRAGVLLCCAAHAAGAHVASNGFVSAEVAGAAIGGSVEIAVRDAELAVGVDVNRDGRVTWGELRAAGPRLDEYLAAHLAFSAQGAACQLTFGDLRVDDRSDGNYAWLPFSARCPAPVRRLTVHYRLMAGIDPSHRGLLTLAAAGEVQTAVLGGAAAEDAFDLGRPSRWHAFGDYFQAGVRHILSGIDHLLFLISLLLPAVLLRRARQWQPVGGGRAAALDVVRIVTAFTLAHSITLSLAALGVVRLPGRFTESVIAASIVVAALNNVFPVITRGRARIAFVFGLLHGFGFASVLSDMGLPVGARALSLFAFNLGIETGQLAVVAAVMPVVYAMRRAPLYRRGVLPWGSALIAAVAAVWFVQRAIAGPA